MNKISLFAVCFLAFALLPGCERNPVNKIVDPTVSNTTGIWSGTWVLYDDELKTGGNIMLFTEGVSLDFNNTDNPHSGPDSLSPNAIVKKCIRFSWDGSPVFTYSTSAKQSDFTGFSLICAQTTAAYSTQTRNLSLGGYTKITFWARGSLSTNVYLRVEANSTDPNQYALASGSVGVWQGTVTSDWNKYSVKIDNSVNNLAAATDFVKFILVYDEDGNPNTANTGRSNGGAVYLDDIELSK